MQEPNRPEASDVQPPVVDDAVAESPDAPPPPSSPVVPIVRIIGLLAAVAAFVLAGKMFFDSTTPTAIALNNKTVNSAYKFTAGTPAPDFTLKTPNGEMVSLSDFRGRPVMINFWATWCPPCRSEMPDMEQIYREQKGGSNLVILAVNMQEANEPIKDFVSKYGLTFPVLTDVTGDVSQEYGVQSLPTSFFIDAEGKVAAFNIGALNKSALGAKIALTGSPKSLQ